MTTAPWAPANSRIQLAAMLGFLLMLSGCGRAPNRTASSSISARGQSSDSVFEQVQTRGKVAMGVDQYTSSHRFVPLPDGGLISLQTAADDSAAVFQIRRHMQHLAGAFARGDFTLPGFVHDREVPGTAVMAAGRSRIRYTTDTVEGGAQMRIRTSDSLVVRAVHEFLAFQRQDHRAAGHEAGHGDH